MFWIWILIALLILAFTDRDEHNERIRELDREIEFHDRRIREIEVEEKEEELVKMIGLQTKNQLIPFFKEYIKCLKEEKNYDKKVCRQVERYLKQVDKGSFEAYEKVVEIFEDGRI